MKDYNYKDFTGQRITEDISGLTITGSCFSQETPDSEIFPKDTTDVTFISCNLDNVLIPEGCTVIGGSQKRFKVQNDGNDWIVDESNEPVKPIDYKIFEKRSLPIPKPEDIPEAKVEIPVDLYKEAEIIKNTPVEEVII